MMHGFEITDSVCGDEERRTVGSWNTPFLSTAPVMRVIYVNIKHVGVVLSRKVNFSQSSGTAPMT